MWGYLQTNVVEYYRPEYSSSLNDSLREWKSLSQKWHGSRGSNNHFHAGSVSEVKGTCLYCSENTNRVQYARTLFLLFWSILQSLTKHETKHFQPTPLFVPSAMDSSTIQDDFGPSWSSHLPTTIPSNPDIAIIENEAWKDQAHTWANAHLSWRRLIITPKLTLLVPHTPN
jgi:hypothetical protein